jgi:hypothetical protein
VRVWRRDTSLAPRRQLRLTDGEDSLEVTLDELLTLASSSARSDCHRSVRRRRPNRKVLCLAAQVLGDWGPALRTVLLIFILVATAVISVMLASMWARTLGLSVVAWLPTANAAAFHTVSGWPGGL